VDLYYQSHPVGQLRQLLPVRQYTPAVQYCQSHLAGRLDLCSLLNLQILLQRLESKQQLMDSKSKHLLGLNYHDIKNQNLELMED
jgi:hypothetical protein